SLYVAPLIVTVAGSVAAALLLQPPGCAEAPAPTDRPAAATRTCDSATLAVLRAFASDPAGSRQKYHGKTIRATGIIALIRPGEVELYGDALPGSVEGSYLLCRFDPGQQRPLLARNQVVTVKGRISGYVHHRTSPCLVLDGCRVVH